MSRVGLTRLQALVVCAYLACELAGGLLALVDASPRLASVKVVPIGTTVFGLMLAGVALSALTRHGLPGRLRPAGASPRPGWQLALALAVFPLPFVLSALGFLIDGWLDRPRASRWPDLVAGSQGWTALAGPIRELADICAVVALIALLMRAADGSRLSALGFDHRDLRLDMRRAVLAFTASFAAIGLGHQLLAILGLLGLEQNSPAGAAPGIYLPWGLAGALAAGVVEELVVLGFLVRQLAALKWSYGRIILAAVLIRSSFHIYYGWGLLWVMPWAATTALLYLRWGPRRVMPFVIAHATWDTVAAINTIYQDAYVLLGTVGGVAALSGLAWYATRSRFLGRRRAAFIRYDGPPTTAWGSDHKSAKSNAKR